jgi:TonB family protein
MRKLVVVVSLFVASGVAVAADATLITRSLSAVSAGSLPVDNQVNRITVEADAYNRPIALKRDVLGVAPVKYPTEALKRGREGRVVLDFVVAADGSVRHSVIRQSSGSARLDDAAVSAARGWSFSPEVQNGKAVAARALVPVDFRIALAD